MSLKSNRLSKSIWAETVNTVSLLVTVCDIVATVISVPFAVLPKCSSCPGVSPQRCFARSVHTRGLGKIISHSAGHSVATDFWATKKSRHTNIYRLSKRAYFSLCGLVSYSCNRLWNSKSKPSFTLICCWQFKAIQKRRCFRLAHRSIIRLKVVP